MSIDAIHEIGPDAPVPGFEHPDALQFGDDGGTIGFLLLPGPEAIHKLSLPGHTAAGLLQQMPSSAESP